MPVSEQEVEVLEGLPEEEGLHHVLGPNVEGVADVADGRVAAAHSAIVLDALKKDSLVSFQSLDEPGSPYLEYLPPPVLVGLVPGEVVEVEQALDRLRPQQVVRVVGLHVKVLRGA